MPSEEAEQQEQPVFDLVMELAMSTRQALAHRFSQTVRFVTENSATLHLVTLFLTFLILQTVHIHNVNRLKADLTAFLRDNEALEAGNEIDQVNQFMAHYDCHSLVSCLDKVVRVGAHHPASPLAQLHQQHPEHAPSDHWFDHVTELNAVEQAAVSWPLHNIDLASSLVTAARKRKELVILDRLLLRSHSIPADFVARNM